MDKHRPGMIISRVFKLKKHRQRFDQRSRPTSYSFPATRGIVFCIHLRGSFWREIPPPDPQQPRIDDFYMNPRSFVHEDSCDKCVYDFQQPDQVKSLINKYEAGTFTRWKSFRSVGFQKKYIKASGSVYNIGEFSAEKLLQFGEEILAKLKTKGKTSRHFKTYYLPGIGICINLKNAKMQCYRGFQIGDSLEARSVFTKASGCTAKLNIGFWGVINSSTMKITRIVTELVYPDKGAHNYSLDEFSISASIQS